MYLKYLRYFVIWTAEILKTSNGNICGTYAVRSSWCISSCILPWRCLLHWRWWMRYAPAGYGPRPPTAVFAASQYSASQPFPPHPSDPPADDGMERRGILFLPPPSALHPPPFTTRTTPSPSAICWQKQDRIDFFFYQKPIQL